MKTKDKGQSLEIAQLLQRNKELQTQLNWLIEYQNKEIEKAKEQYDYWREQALINIEYRIQKIDLEFVKPFNISTLYLKVNK